MSISIALTLFQLASRTVGGTVPVRKYADISFRRDGMTLPDTPYRPALSVVAPCFNEQACVVPFLDRMISACEAAADGSYEILLVNDGSTDGTWAYISSMALTRPGVVGINLSRNHGHQLAVTAGLSEARGQRVLIIDADLQDPPEVLGEMMERMDQGFDVVYGRRRAREGETPFKRATAHHFYRLLANVSDVDIPSDAGDFRLISRAFVDRLNAMPEQDRFLRGMVAWLGGRQSEVLYDRDSRHAGQTGYTLKKMVRLALAGLTGFSTAPLRVAAMATSFGIAIGAALTLYILAGVLSGNAVPGWASLGLIVVFFSTAQLGCLAIISVYVGRIFMQVKQRPLFVIHDIVRSQASVALAPPKATPALLQERRVAAG
jgi:dolichol-phosphate mannosyltransferase